MLSTVFISSRWVKRTVLVLVGAGVIVVLSILGLISTTTGQDFLLARGAQAIAATSGEGKDGLQVFVCGSASPIPAPGRAQACIAILTPEHFFVVDAGSGSANVIGVERLPFEDLDGVLLTHFHSDHIVDLPSINVQAWAAGHAGPVKVYGPPGVSKVVHGFNMAMSHDRIYRTAHHGREFMPVSHGLMEPVEQPVVSTQEFGDLAITSIAAAHSPVEPAVSYRFDYRGRSVVVTGDTIVTKELREFAREVDLLLTDAMSLPIVETIRSGMSATGNDRLAKILLDIQDYHADVEDVIDMTRSSAIGMTALYHLVPGPRNFVMEKVFLRGAPDNMVLTEDGMWFTLPLGSDEIEVRR
jgi:ribonuclease Z